MPRGNPHRAAEAVPNLRTVIVTTNASEWATYTAGNRRANLAYRSSICAECGDGMVAYRHNWVCDCGWTRPRYEQGKDNE